MIFLLMLMGIYRSIWWFAIVIISVMSSAPQLSCWNVFFKSPISSIQWNFHSMQCTGGYHMLCILTCGIDVSLYMPKSAKHIWAPCNWNPRVSGEWSYLNNTAVLPLLDTMFCHLQEVPVCCCYLD